MQFTIGLKSICHLKCIQFLGHLITITGISFSESQQFGWYLSGIYLSSCQSRRTTDFPHVDSVSSLPLPPKFTSFPLQSETPRHQSGPSMGIQGIIIYVVQPLHSAKKSSKIAGKFAWLFDMCMFYFMFYCVKRHHGQGNLSNKVFNCEHAYCFRGLVHDCHGAWQEEGRQVRWSSA